MNWIFLLNYLYSFYFSISINTLFSCAEKLSHLFDTKKKVITFIWNKVIKKIKTHQKSKMSLNIKKLY